MKKRQDAIEEAYAAQVRPARYRSPGGPNLSRAPDRPFK